MIEIRHPFPKSWWVEPGQFLAGCYPGDLDPEKAEAKLRALLDAGIRSVVNLQVEGETANGKAFVPYREMLHRLSQVKGIETTGVRIAIRDNDVPSRETMLRILDVIDAAIHCGQPVYVHCWGGHGRTATVVGCWLVRRGYTGRAALERILHLRGHDTELRRRPAPQTRAQIEMVRDWHE